MSIECPQRYQMARGEARHVFIDWGENTADAKTGVLGAGDTVSSCACALQDSPSGSTTPTLGSVTVPTNSSSDDINGRIWSTGEATTNLVTMGASQAYGKYVLRYTATTASAEVIPRDVVIDVVAK